MYERAVIKLTNAGYGRYEISNFSLPGYECRHNMNYWERGEYLGLGPGAWSFISGRRYANIADTTEYVQRLSSGRTIIDDQENRWFRGRQRGKRSSSVCGPQRDWTFPGLNRSSDTTVCAVLREMRSPLRQAGLLRVLEGRLTLTDRGILLLDEALARLSV